MFGLQSSKFEPCFLFYVQSKSKEVLRKRSKENSGKFYAWWTSHTLLFVVKIPRVLWENIFYRKGRLSKNEYNLKIL